jgi:hypothetical protein
MPAGDSSVYFGTRACADYVSDEAERLKLFVSALELARENDYSFRNWFDRQIAETLLTRAVDGFLTYLAELLAMVYEANPNALPAEASIPVSLALELDDRDALARELAGRRVRALSRKGADALNKPFAALHFPVFRSKSERRAIESALAQRDLIVHSRGVVDRAYLRRVPECRTAIGEPLPLKRLEAVEDSLMLVDAAIRVDQAALERWRFDTVEIQLGSSEVELAPQPSVAADARA